MNERFLRQLWRQQTFVKSLQSTDGKPIQVIHPGTPNLDSGPDFREAIVEIGHTRYRGEVEIHAENALWHLHKHHLDPRYNTVILHVVMDLGSDENPPLTESGRILPVLVMSNFLSAPLRTLWRKIIADDRQEKLNSIPCAPRNRNVPAIAIHRMLQRAGRERLELKIRRQHERLRDIIDQRRFGIGEEQSRYEIEMRSILPASIELSLRDYSVLDDWEQLLYEGIAEALGYSKNVVPFLRLSRNLRLSTLRRMVELSPQFNSLEIIAAALFGASGFLSDSAQTKVMIDLRNELKRIWRSVEPFYRGSRLQEVEWTFFRLRPANFPTRRLMALAVLADYSLSSGGMLPIIVRLFKDEEGGATRTKELIRIAQADHILRELFTKEDKKLLAAYQGLATIGKARAIDIVVNVFIPTLLLYARIFKDRSLRKSVLSVYGALPKMQNNSISRLMEEQLIRQRFKIETPFQQQATIQLYKFYCAEQRCSECEIGRMVVPE